MKKKFTGRQKTRKEKREKCGEGERGRERLWSEGVLDSLVGGDNHISAINMALAAAAAAATAPVPSGEGGGAQSAADLWRRTCRVPPHPARCPECGQRVRLYHINPDNDAIIMCSNQEVRQ